MEALLHVVGAVCELFCELGMHLVAYVFRSDRHNSQ
jgi:hypothetical protein